MLQAELNNRVAAALGEAETKLREIVFDAARGVEKLGHAVNGEITLLVDDMRASVVASKAAITIEGSHVGHVTHLLGILDGLHHLLGLNPKVDEFPADTDSGIEMPPANIGADGGFEAPESTPDHEEYASHN